MRCPHPGEVRALTGTSPVTGFTSDRFEAVKRAFTENFSRGECGASLCVIVEGSVVVDLTGGWCDQERTIPWTHDTLVNSFSVGKGILSLVLARLHHTGALDLGRSARDVWPSLSAARDSAITIAGVAAHRMGLPAVHRSIDAAELFDWDSMCRHLERQEPWWPPGTTHGYHVNTFGFLVGELAARSTGLSAGQLLEPMRSHVHDQMFWGVPTNELHRCAELLWHVPDTAPATTSDPSGPMEMQRLTYANPPNFSGVGEVNSARWRQMVHPSTNLHATARGVARAYASLEDHGFVSPATIERLTRTESHGHDAVLGAETHFGVGFQLPTVRRTFGQLPGAFGHYGAGGSMGYHDVGRRLSVGYVMNQMGKGWQNPRNQALVDAISACL